MSSNNFQMGHCEDCLMYKCEVASLKGRIEAYHELKDAAIALVQRLELDKDVKKNNWWLNERAQLAEAIDNVKKC